MCYNEQPKAISECETYDELLQNVRQRIDFWLDSKEEKTEKNAEYWRGFLRGCEELVNLAEKKGTIKIRHTQVGNGPKSSMLMPGVSA